MFIVESLLPIFGATVLPVFLVAFAGFLLGRRFELDNRTIGRVLFYLATPSLVFRSLYRMEIEYSSLCQIALVSVSMVILTGFLGWLWSLCEGGRVQGNHPQERRKQAAIMLTAAVPNNGNMGIPISLFAFGEPGLALGAIYYVATSFVSNSLGAVVASAGSAPLLVALKQGMRVPTLYAAALGLALNWLQWQIPLGLFRAVDLLGNAAVPGMLLLMGIQLSASSLRGQFQILAGIASIRLLLAPILAVALCTLGGIIGLERNIIILQASMPTAVMVSILVTEFDAAPELAAAAVFFTTICSLVTLSVLLWFLI